MVGEVCSQGNENSRDNSGEVSQSETEGDVGCGSGFAAVSKASDWSVGVRGDVLGESSDDESRDETEQCAEEGVDWSSARDGLSEQSELVRSRIREIGSEVRDTNEDDSGDDKRDLEGELDLVVGLNLHDVGGEQTDQDADDNTEGDHQKRIHEVADEVVAGSSSDQSIAGDHEGCAGGLCEGAEEIGGHTSDIPDVVTNIISNGSRVFGAVFGQVLLKLTNEIGADISSLGVDTSSHSSEKCNKGASETIASD